MRLSSIHSPRCIDCLLPQDSPAARPVRYHPRGSSRRPSWRVVRTASAITDAAHECRVGWAVASTTGETCGLCGGGPAEPGLRPAWCDDHESGATVSIHLSRGSGTLRRVVLSCDVAGCPVQLEPPAIEAWRNDADARSWARDHAAGWTSDPIRQTDYCPEHAQSSVAPPADLVPPRPTATVRDRSGSPLNRDEYAERLRERLGDSGRSTGQTMMLTAAEAAVAARLLDELAGVYRGESLGRLAQEVSALLDSRLGDRG